MCSLQQKKDVSVNLVSGTTIYSCGMNIEQKCKLSQNRSLSKLKAVIIISQTSNQIAK
jgi:hypothetical protein